MPGVGLKQLLDSQLISFLQELGLVVVGAFRDFEPSYKVPAPSGLDFFQDG